MKNSFLLLLAVLSVSCSMSRYMATDVTCADISDVARFETMSEVTVINKIKRTTPDDSLSQAIGERIDGIVSAQSPFPLLPEEITFSDTMEMKAIAEDLLVLAQAVENRKSSGSKKERAIPIFTTHRIDSIVTARGVNQAMMVVHVGFTRTTGNMVGNVVLGVGLGVMTTIASGGLFSFYTVPVKANSAMHVFIVDRERKKLLFYDNAFIQNEPHKDKILTKQVNKIFKEI